MVRANGSPVFVSDRLAPLLDQRADLRLICCVLWFVRHVFPALRKCSALNLASRKPMHQTQGRANGGTRAHGGRLPLVASDAVAALSHEEEENAASFVRFQFHETANESKDCQMRRAASDHNAWASNGGHGP